MKNRKFLMILLAVSCILSVSSMIWSLSTTSWLKRSVSAPVVSSIGEIKPTLNTEPLRDLFCPGYSEWIQNNINSYSSLPSYKYNTESVSIVNRISPSVSVDDQYHVLFNGFAKSTVISTPSPVTGFDKITGLKKLQVILKAIKEVNGITGFKETYTVTPQTQDSKKAKYDISDYKCVPQYLW